MWKVYQWLVILLVYTIKAIECNQAGYCDICGVATYCGYGCCNSNGASHCCEDVTAVVAGSLCAGLFVGLVVTALAVWAYQQRRIRIDNLLMQNMDKETQYMEEDFKNPPSAQNGAAVHSAPTPQGPPADLDAVLR